MTDEFTIATGEPERYGERVSDINGHPCNVTPIDGTEGLFAVAYLNPNCFTLTHVPTGYALCPFETRADAASFGEKLYAGLTADERVLLRSSDVDDIREAMPKDAQNKCSIAFELWRNNE